MIIVVAKVIAIVVDAIVIIIIDVTAIEDAIVINIIVILVVIIDVVIIIIILNVGDWYSQLQCSNVYGQRQAARKRHEFSRPPNTRLLQIDR